MQEQQNRITAIVLGILVTISLTLAGWSIKTQVEQGKLIAAMQQHEIDYSGRIDYIEAHGSRQLETHVKDDDTRVQALKDQMNELKAANILLSPLPGKIETLNVKIDSLKEGQKRVEDALTDARKALK